MGEPYGSTLSVAEHTALRSVGYAPVGLVLGSAVYNVGWNPTGCTYQGEALTWVGSVPAGRELLEGARDSAVGRLRRECARLGADGVVGVRVTVTPFDAHSMELLVVGTAVRAAGGGGGEPFTSYLSAQDFAKLAGAGQRPVALVLGVGAKYRHHDWAVRTDRSMLNLNQELLGPTELVIEARRAARDALAADAARHGGGTVLLRHSHLRVQELPCRKLGETDNEPLDVVVEVGMWGTLVTPAPGPAAPPKPLAILPLGRRPAGRGPRRAG